MCTINAKKKKKSEITAVPLKTEGAGGKKKDPRVNFKLCVSAHPPLLEHLGSLRFGGVRDFHSDALEKGLHQLDVNLSLS